MEAKENTRGYQARVREEKRELDVKIAKLKLKLKLGLFNKLNNTVSEHEQRLLARQYEIMKDYSDILEARIDGF